MSGDTFESAEGRSVVAADTATNIGEVKGFLVDPTATRIDSIHISGRGRRASIVPWASIQSFGNDAVVVTEAEAPERVEGDHDTQAVKGNITLQGTRVLTTAGFEAGTVDNVMFDTDSGQITGATTTEGRVDADRFKALGSYALIIDPE